MCGRFTLRIGADKLAAAFGVSHPPLMTARYNIAPASDILAVRVLPGSRARDVAALRWGLIPSWSAEASGERAMINARGETVGDKPSFRKSIRERRCLVPADGWYEWKKEGTKKIPYFFTRADGEPFAFAGIWDRWEKGGAPAIQSCALITTAANSLSAPIHDRMPVIVPPSDFDRWLDPGNHALDSILPLLAPCPPGDVTVWRVDPIVNSPRVDDSRCVAPVREG